MIDQKYILEVNMMEKIWKHYDRVKEYETGQKDEDMDMHSQRKCTCTKSIQIIQYVLVVYRVTTYSIPLCNKDRDVAVSVLFMCKLTYDES